MRFDLHKLVIFELAFLLQYLILDADLTDVMHKRDVMVFLDVFVVIAEFLCEHGCILGHTEGMTVRIVVLHMAETNGGVITVSVYSDHDVTDGVVYEPVVRGKKMSNTTHIIGKLDGVTVSDRVAYSSRYSR